MSEQNKHDEQQTTSSPHFICARCHTLLQPGCGNFYQVTIEAVADPHPPILCEEDRATIQKEILRLLAQLESTSEKEAMNQVYRHVSLCLCRRCYRDWIENPVR